MESAQLYQKLLQGARKVRTIRALEKICMKKEKKL